MFGNNSFGNTSFGNNTFGSGFGATQNPAPPTGTTIRFIPPAGMDTVPKSGNAPGPSQVTTRHQNISAMKEYESKCNDELRLEDYLANRKVGQPQGFGTPSFVGQQNTTAQPNTSLFGGNNQASSSFGMFGNMNKPATGATNASPFQMNSPFSTTTPAATGGLSLFNQNSQANTTPFGANSLTTPNKSIFGTPSVATTTTTSIFGANNATNTSASGGLSLFGSQPQAGASPFGATGINNMNKPTSLFGTGAPATSTASIFGTNNNANTSATGGLSLFGSQPQSGASPFGTASLNKTTNLFGSPSAVAGTSPLFGANNNQANTSGFLGQNNLLSQSQSAFGQAQQTLAQPQSGLGSPEALMTRLKTLPYGETSLFLSDTSTSPGVGSLKFTTDPKTINQYKISAKTSVKLNTPSSSEKTRANSVLFDGLDDTNNDDLRCAIDVFVPKRSIKKLDLSPTTQQLEGDS